MKKNWIIPFTILFSHTACSSLKDYVSKGEPNFTASFKAEGSFLQSKNLNVNIFQYTSNCKAVYLGTIEMGRNETKKIALPVNRAIVVKLLYYKHIWWANHETLQESKPFKMVPRREARYSLEFEVEGDSIGSNYYDVSNGRKQDLAQVEFFKNCKEFDSE